MSHARRIPSLDGLRGIAATAVMAFHFNIFFLPQARLSDILPFLPRAYLAVDLFFLLSGFVMVHVYGRELSSHWRAHWRGFATARFARIYPLFAVTILAMVISVTVSDTRLRWVSFSGRSLALQPFLLQQWSSLSWNYPSWSISTEAEAYIFFVFAARLLVTGEYPRLMGAACVAILAALCMANGGSLHFVSGTPALLRTLAEFSLGALLYRAHSDCAGFPRKWAAILAVLLVGLATITRLDLLIVGAFGCLIYYLVNAEEAFGRLLNSRPSVALGNWSYSIYLWHAPMHYAVMTTFAARGYPVINLGLRSARLLLSATALAVVGLSAVSYQYFETRVRLSLVRHTTTVADIDRARPVLN
jgi:peptidoglycan/LPS O-acetylase OafA/YrhL